MMSIQLKIWKRLIPKQLPSSCHSPSIVTALFPSLPFYAKPHIKLANFCSQVATPSTTPPDRGVVSDFLISKCGLSEEDITKGFRHCNRLLRVKSTQNLEEVLELLKGCGLTTPAQLRRVVLRNPDLLFFRSENNVKSKLSFFRTFMKEEDLSKLVINDARVFNNKEDKIKSTISVLQRLGYEGKALSHLVAKTPCLVTTLEERLMELFKLVENLGLKKGSKSFAAGLHALWGIGKEKLERRLHCLSCLGFSEKQILVLSARDPRFLGLTEERLKRNVDFLVKSVGFPLSKFLIYPSLLSYSLEKRIIPRYRVMEALKSMQVQELKRGIFSSLSFLLTEKLFLEKYVNNNPESPILLDIYHGRKSGKLIDKETRSDCDSIEEICRSSETSSGVSI